MAKYIAHYAGGFYIELDATTFEDAELEAEDYIAVDAWNGYEYYNEHKPLIRIEEQEQ